MQRLKLLRTERKLTQADIAAYLKIDRTTYAKYESGASDPPTATLVKLAEFFSVSVDHLIGADTPSDSAAPSSARETAISLFDSLPDDAKNDAIRFMRYLASDKGD